MWFIVMRVVAGEAIVLLDSDSLTPPISEGLYHGSLRYTPTGFELTTALRLYGEPNCCTCGVKTETFAWNGNQFKVTHTSTTKSSKCRTFLQGGTWRQIDVLTEVPSARHGAAMVYDLKHNRVIIFGGRRDTTPLDDTWAFDLRTRTWKALAAGDAVRPPARFGMVVDVALEDRSFFVTTGMGETGKLVNDVWRFDLDSNTWAVVSVTGDMPTPRYGAAGAINDVDDVLYLSHGFTATGPVDDAWVFSLLRLTWQQLTPKGPWPQRRFLPVAAVTQTSGEDRGELLLFGGCASQVVPCVLGDTWRFEGKARRWTAIRGQGGPEARQSAGLVPLNYNIGELLLFGGQAATQTNLNDMWVFDEFLQEWTEVTTRGTPPSPRHGHSIVWVMNDNTQRRRYMLLFGGRSQGQDLNDLWMLLPEDS